VSNEGDHPKEERGRRRRGKSLAEPPLKRSKQQHEEDKEKMERRSSGCWRERDSCENGYIWCGVDVESAQGKKGVRFLKKL